MRLAAPGFVFLLLGGLAFATSFLPLGKKGLQDEQAFLAAKTASPQSSLAERVIVVGSAITGHESKESLVATVEVKRRDRKLRPAHPEQTGWILVHGPLGEVRLQATPLEFEQFGDHHQLEEGRKIWLGVKQGESVAAFGEVIQLQPLTVNTKEAVFAGDIEDLRERYTTRGNQVRRAQLAHPTLGIVLLLIGLGMIGWHVLAHLRGWMDRPASLIQMSFPSEFLLGQSFAVASAAVPGVIAWCFSPLIGYVVGGGIYILFGGVMAYAIIYEQYCGRGRIHGDEVVDFPLFRYAPPQRYFRSTTRHPVHEHEIVAWHYPYLTLGDPLPRPVEQAVYFAKLYDPKVCNIGFYSLKKGFSEGIISREERLPMMFSWRTVPVDELREHAKVMAADPKVRIPPELIQFVASNPVNIEVLQDRMVLYGNGDSRFSEEQLARMLELLTLIET